MTRKEMIKEIETWHWEESRELDKYKLKFGLNEKRKSICKMLKSELEEVYNNIKPKVEAKKEARRLREELKEKALETARKIPDSKIESKGYLSIKAAVIRDTKGRDHCDCFNIDGCNVKGARIGEYGEEGSKSCFHRYCDNFKWIIERAKHYQVKTGIPYMEILDSWEESRNYWHMNYYQDCNQPLILSDEVKIFDTVEELKESIGDQGFRCPSCGSISKNPYECDSEECDWVSYGLLGTLGKGVTVFSKDKLKIDKFFTPIKWEKTEETKNGKNI